MARGYRNYTNDDIRREAAIAVTLSDLLRRLNLRPAGGNYINMRRNLQKLQIDCSHWSSEKGNGYHPKKNERLVIIH